MRTQRRDVGAPVPQDELTAQVRANEDGWLNPDQHRLDLLAATLTDDVSTILDILRNHSPIDQLQPTTSAGEHARQLAQRGTPATSLIRAYHLVRDNLLAQLFHESHQLECNSELKLKVVRYISAALYRYIDGICLDLLKTHDEEWKPWSTASGNVQTSLIQKILANQPVDVSLFAAETGYSLDQFHVGSVVWSARDHLDEMLVLDRGRDLAARAASSSAPILTAIDHRTVWAWFPRGDNDAPVDMDLMRKFAAEASCRIAIGLPTDGLAGFRRSHHQAEAVRVVALASSSKMEPAVSYGDQGVAILTVLANDLEWTSTWVRDTSSQDGGGRHQHDGRQHGLDCPDGGLLHLSASFVQTYPRFSAALRVTHPTGMFNQKVSKR